MMLQTHRPVERRQAARVFDATTIAAARRASARAVQRAPRPCVVVADRHARWLPRCGRRSRRRSSSSATIAPIRTVTTSFLRPGAVGPADCQRRGRCAKAARSPTSRSRCRSRRSRRRQSGHGGRCGREHGVGDDSPSSILPPIEDCVPIAPPPGIGHFDHGVAMLDPDGSALHPRTARTGGGLHATDRAATDRCAPGSAWRSTGFLRRRSRGSIHRPAASASATRSTSTARWPELGDDEWLGGDVPCRHQRRRDCPREGCDHGPSTAASWPNRSTPVGRPILGADAAP